MAWLSFKRPKRDRPGKRRVRGALTSLGWRARPGADGPTAQDKAIALGAPGYPVIDGPHYIDVLGALQRRLRPRWYLEIGSFKGHSLSQACGDYIAVDPDFQLAVRDMPMPQRAHFFRMTSQAFFESGFLARNDIAVDLAFLDGLHHYEVLLQDFIAAEAVAAPGARIVLHDCLPSSDAMAAREWADGEPAWAGDVWKTLAILRAERPDLRIAALDAWPTGLVVIDNLDPADRTLAAAAPRAVGALRATTLAEYGVARFYEGMPILSSVRFLDTPP